MSEPRAHPGEAIEDWKPPDKSFTLIRPGARVRLPNGRIVSSRSYGWRRLLGFSGNVYINVYGTGAVEAAMAAEAARFDPASVSFLSLVDDTGTRDTIAKLLPKETVVPFSLKAPTRDHLRAAIKAARGRLLVVLGHVSGDSFAILDPRGREAWRIPREWLKKEAAASGVSLFELGCESAALAPTGVANPFNTVVAVQNLSRALHAQTVLAFWSSIAGSHLALVVDGSTLAATGVPSHRVTMDIIDGPYRSLVGSDWNYVSFDDPPHRELAQVWLTLAPRPPPLSPSRTPPGPVSEVESAPQSGTVVTQSDAGDSAPLKQSAPPPVASATTNPSDESDWRWPISGAVALGAAGLTLAIYRAARRSRPHDAANQRSRRVHD